MGMCYSVGAVIDFLDLPERWMPPGMLDLWGNSHHVFHVCVILAGCVHYVGMLQLQDYTAPERVACGALAAA